MRQRDKQTGTTKRSTIEGLLAEPPGTKGHWGLTLKFPAAGLFL